MSAKSKMLTQHFNIKCDDLTWNDTIYKRAGFAQYCSRHSLHTGECRFTPCMLGPTICESLR